MRNIWLVPACVSAVLGCSSPKDAAPQTSMNSTGGMGAGGGTHGTGGSPVGAGGTSGVGKGNSGGSVGSGGALGTGGKLNGAGGVQAASGGSTGTSGGTSAGGAGLGSGGDSNSALGGAANSDISAALQGQRWEAPCGTHSDDECENFPPGQTSCPPNGYTMVDRMIQFGGTVGQSYDVTLRFRGVLEPKVYEGGTASGGHLYIGGTAPGSGYNVYSLEVASPKTTLFFNSDDGQGEGHNVFAIDQTTTVRINAGSSVRLFAHDSNCVLLANCDRDNGCGNTPYIVPGVPPSTGFDGQFVQMDVVSVVVAN